MTKEEAAAAVEAAFRDAHKSVEKAWMDATQLAQEWIKTCRVVGMHPNDTSEASHSMGEAINNLGTAMLDLAVAHHEAAIVRDRAVAEGKLELPIETQDGGGKRWP